MRRPERTADRASLRGVGQAEGVLTLAEMALVCLMFLYLTATLSRWRELPGVDLGPARVTNGWTESSIMTALNLMVVGATVAAMALPALGRRGVVVGWQASILGSLWVLGALTSTYLVWGVLGDPEGTSQNYVAAYVAAAAAAGWGLLALLATLLAIRADNRLHGERPQDETRLERARGRP